MKQFFFLIIVLLCSCTLIKNKLTFFPDTKTEVPKEQIPSYFKKKVIKTLDGETLEAFYLQHQNTSIKKLVIYFHGNAGNLYHRFDAVRRIYHMGFNVLIPSYRGYSKSTGSPSEAGIYEDGRAAVRFSKESLGYEEEMISLVSRSLGTTVAIEIVQNRLFRRLILITPLTSGRDMGKYMLPAFTSIAGDSYNSINKADKIITPTMVIHGTEDETIPFIMGEKIYNKLCVPKEFVKITGGRHNDLEMINPSLFWESIERFLQKEF